MIGDIILVLLWVAAIIVLYKVFWPKGSKNA